MGKAVRMMFYVLFFAAAFSSCKKQENIIPDNTPPDYSFVPTVSIQNYVNRLYLDMLGRNALPEEMDSTVALLKRNHLDTATRIAIVEKLQNDATFRPGDSSYAIAYYNRFYSMMKSRLLEGVEDDYINEEIGNSQSALNAAISAGDSFETAKQRAKINGLHAVLDSRYNYRSGGMSIDSIHLLFINNWVYDQINMNTFNFINATFDNMYYRFPTQEEFNTGYAMVEHNQSGSLLGFSGSSRSDYLHIVTGCSAFYEGIVIWAYKSLLSRNPTATEVVKSIDLIRVDKNFKALQKKIVVTDEYAHFN